jgi:hypothetical protein
MKHIKQNTVENEPDIYPAECSICKGSIIGIYDDHNAEPVTDERCCSDCNATVVIPARFYIMRLRRLILKKQSK